MREVGYRRLVKPGVIRNLRENALMTQQELAEAAGVSRLTVIEYERPEPKRPPHPLCIRKVAKALDVDPRDLVTITFD